MWIDVNLDVRADSRGRDPDLHSPSLRQFHKILWSKDLPSGNRLALTDQVPGTYLRAEVADRYFSLASDSAIPTFTMRKRLKPILDYFPPDDLKEFRDLSYTIGAFIVFPGDRRDGQMTINGARGFNHRISDRFDLTLECIRRHYLGQSSPLSETLSRYNDWFDLFIDFAGFVEFFLLQDFVSSRYEVIFQLPFDDFSSSGSPKDAVSYDAYKTVVTSMVARRNQRIAQSQNLVGDHDAGFA